jgi:hypothetical protein
MQSSPEANRKEQVQHAGQRKVRSLVLQDALPPLEPQRFLHQQHRDAAWSFTLDDQIGS